MKTIVRGGVLLALGIFSIITGVCVAKVFLAKAALVIAGIFFIIMGIGCVLNVGGTTQKDKGAQAPQRRKKKS